MVHKRVLVVMIVTYFGQTMDKLSDVPSCFLVLANLSSRTISFASIMGIVQDTHLVGQQYVWLTTCGTRLFRNDARRQMNSDSVDQFISRCRIISYPIYLMSIDHLVTTK